MQTHVVVGARAAASIGTNYGHITALRALAAGVHLYGVPYRETQGLPVGLHMVVKTSERNWVRGMQVHSWKGWLQVNSLA